MAWSTPLTAVSNATLTAAQWNASVRDNLLMTSPALATTAGSIFAATGTNAIAERIPTANTVGTLQTTTSTTYTDLATVGPAVTVTTGPRALVIWGCEASNGTSNVSSYMGYAVSGATTVAAVDSVCLKVTIASGAGIQASRALIQGLTAGSNTFTAKYRVDANTGTFSQRTINVVPF
jgi:hypothetical protein